MKHDPKGGPSSFPGILQCGCFRHTEGDDADTSFGTEMHGTCAALVHEEEPPELVLMEQKDREDCESIVSEGMALVRDNLAPGTVIDVEKQVELFDDDMNRLTYGTGDIAGHDTKLVVALDWKSGLDYRPEIHDFSSQLFAYALAGMRKHKVNRALCIEAYIRPGKIRPYFVDYTEAAAVVGCALQRRADPDFPPQVCDFCKYCKAFLHCPAVNKQIVRIGDCYGDLTPPAEALKPLEITNPNDMSKLLTFAKNVLKPYAKRIADSNSKNGVADKIEKAAMAMSDENVEIPYYARVVKQGKKSIKPENYPKVLQLSTLSAAEFYESLGLSLPKLGKAYAKKHSMTEAAARSEVEGLVNSFIDVSKAGAELKYTQQRSFGAG